MKRKCIRLIFLIVALISALDLKTQVQVNCTNLSLSQDTFYLNPTNNIHVMADLHYRDTNMTVYPILRLILQDTALIKSPNIQVLSFLAYPIDSIEQFDFEITFKTANYPNNTVVNAWFHIYDADTPGDSLVTCYFPIRLILQNPLSNIETGQNQLQLTLYPNPTGSAMVLEYLGTEEMDLFIYNLGGELVKSQMNLRGGKNQIDVSTLKPGMYFFRAMDKEKSLKTGKIGISR